MPIRLTIEIEQDSADYDQLGHLAMSIEDDITTGNVEHGSGIRVLHMTMVNEFGGLVVRTEPERAIFAQPDGTVEVQERAKYGIKADGSIGKHRTVMD
jgi:hypothetical protein